jgi:hypothetical protein
MIALALPGAPAMADRAEERTAFQEGGAWRPEIDVQADVAIVYGAGPSLPDRAESWRRRGYLVHFMTGVAWGGYHDYFGGQFDGREHWAEVQTRRDGSRMAHGGSRDVFYNVPTSSYTAYLKTVLKQAIDAGVSAIHLEEPEYWVEAGYSDAFKEAWRREYGEPWQPPHESVEARWRADRLKQKLYTDCLAELFGYAKAYARSKGREVRCFVPTHSLINYAQWRIVSPEGNLMAIREADGYVAQVWTGTARTPNLYRGVARERTFETAFLEYGQMVNMVRPSGRRCYLLADPVEDNPSRTWSDYRRNYEATVAASLFQPEGWHYEIMPWPGRIFRGAYPGDEPGGARRTISPEYATEVMAVTQALRDMKQERVAWDSGTTGVGVLLSDSIMFQRGTPAPPDPHLSSFFGLALPLLKAGVPVEVVSLENAGWPGALAPYRVLLLTYECQKPLRPEYHKPLVEWMRQGGCLMYFDGRDDPFDRVREWWNDDGRTSGTAAQALFRAAGLGGAPGEGFHEVGKGRLAIVKQSPRALAAQAEGAEVVRKAVRDAFEVPRAVGSRTDGPGASSAWRTQNYLSLRRGPYVVSAVLEESVSTTPLRLAGRFIDLFDPALPFVREKIVKPGERSLLVDLDRIEGQGPRVVAASARAFDERTTATGWSAEFRATPVAPAVVRVLLPHEPKEVQITGAAGEKVAEAQWRWDADSRTLWMQFPNSPEGIQARCSW